MDQNHYQSQISRLTETYGGQHYKPERARVIWNEVKNLSNLWMTQTTDYFIGYARQAPLVQEFRERISIERERLHNIEKEKNTEEAEEFMSMYSGEDLATICGQMRDRIKGNMSDENFDGFKKMITPPNGGYNCSRCEDRDLYHDPVKGGMWLCKPHLPRQNAW